MKKSTKQIIIAGLFCLAALAASCVYAVACNDSRLVAPMDFSEYAFTPKDLPMLASMLLIAAYFLFLFVRLLAAILARKKAEAVSRTTRRLNPKLGYLGLLGLLGLSRLWAD